jgi:uncharacterized protein (DUF2236 family)
MYRIPFLPRSVLRSLDAAAGVLLNPHSTPKIDFARPVGEPALLPYSSVSWRVFKNPVALFIGGVAAVILELAHPLVRAAIWQRSSFRLHPMGRLQRTGLAAMVTVYGARSISEPMIAGVVRMHAKIEGKTAAGLAYSANDPRLLSWVNATAAFGFGQAYSRYVEVLNAPETDALYAESAMTSKMYGALHSPHSRTELDSLFALMHEELEPSSVVFQFLEIMRKTPALPKALRWMQPTFVRAAVDLIPSELRLRLGLTETYGMRSWDRAVVMLAGATSNRIMLPHSPATESCLRLGLRADHLY